MDVFKRTSHEEVSKGDEDSFLRPEARRKSAAGARPHSSRATSVRRVIFVFGGLFVLVLLFTGRKEYVGKSV